MARMQERTTGLRMLDGVFCLLAGMSFAGSSCSDLAAAAYRRYQKALKAAGADLSDFDCYGCHEKKKPPVLLVSRLDGPSVAIAMRLVDDTIEIEQKGLAGTFASFAGALPSPLASLASLAPQPAAVLRAGEIRLPVLFIHGLASSPGAWVPMFNELRADPAPIRMPLPCRLSP